MLSENRDEEAATRFFRTTIENNGWPDKVVIDQSGANYAGLMNINIVEQDHRFIKKITKPMMNFKAFHSASATLGGIELAHMIRKKQFKNTDLSDYHQFLKLVA